MWYLLLASVAVAAASYRCDTNSDCELLGQCESGVCKCFPGFKGPSCAQIDLKPKSVSTGMAAWPPENGYALKNESRRAYGWGFSVAPDAKSQGLLHAVANVGCYLPHDNGMVTGTFLMHLISTKGPMGPWKAIGIVAPPVSFNAHLRLASSGQYVLFLRAGLPMPSPTNWEEVACAGVSDTEWKAMVAKGPYITADQLQDPIGNYVATADSMEGNWEAKPFHIVGQDATCGNKSVISHNSNPSAVILPNGVVVLAYRYTFRSGSESVNIAVSQNVSGPYEAVFPCNYSMTSGTWGEDPFIFRRGDGSLHMFYHCMRYGHGLPNSPALHAWSANAGGRGRDKWHTTSSPSHHGAYSTNVSLSNGSFSNLLYHRRERPDIFFDGEGNPSAFYSALQETAPALETVHTESHPQAIVKRGFGWSFSFAQEINTATKS